MKLKLTAIAALAVFGANTAQAAQYFCKADCYTGTLNIAVSANSDTEAANKTNDPSLIEKACRKARSESSSQSTMTSGKCFREKPSSGPTVYAD